LSDKLRNVSRDKRGCEISMKHAVEEAQVLFDLALCEFRITFVNATSKNPFFLLGLEGIAKPLRYVRLSSAIIPPPGSLSSNRFKDITILPRKDTFLCSKINVPFLAK